MNNSTQKSIRKLSIAILFMGGLTLIYTYVQMISQLWLNNFIIPITWNPEIKGWQIFILAARFIGITLLFASGLRPLELSSCGEGRIGVDA